MATKQESKVIATAMQVNSAYQAFKRAEEEGSSKLRGYQDKFKQQLKLLELSLAALAKANLKAEKERKPLEGIEGPPTAPIDWGSFLTFGVEAYKAVRQEMAPKSRGPRRARVIDPNDVIDAEVVE